MSRVGDKGSLFVVRPCRSCGALFKPQSSRQFDCHDCRKRDKRKAR